MCADSSEPYVVVCTAWRNSLTHGSPGRSGGGCQMSPEEWSNGRCSGTCKTAAITFAHVIKNL